MTSEALLMISKALMVLPIFLFASIRDICTKKVVTRTCVAIVGVGFIGINLVESLQGALWVGIPMLIIAVFSKMGGGDVKFSAACGFCFGAPIGIAGTLIGFMLSALIIPIWRKIRKKPIGDFFAFVPFLSIGYLVAAVVCILLRLKV